MSITIFIPNILFKKIYNLFRGRIVAKLILGFLLKIIIISKSRSIEYLECVVNIQANQGGFVRDILITFKVLDSFMFFLIRLPVEQVYRHVNCQCGLEVVDPVLPGVWR